MKRSILLLSAALFCLASGLVSASAKDAHSAQSHVIPVLVNVNAKGEVTDAKPAYKLRPAFVRAIRNTLSKMITKPATNHGKPIDCQFVVNLAMTTVPRSDGAYGVAFKYISSKALPSGSWYWAKNDTHRLALADQRSTDTLNIANVRSARAAAVDVSNQNAAQQHQSFMNQYGH